MDEFMRSAISCLESWTIHNKSFKWIGVGQYPVSTFFKKMNFYLCNNYNEVSN